MNVVDRTLLRLQDADERDGLLDLGVAQGLFDAAYVFEHRVVGTVSAVRVRAIDLLPAIPVDRVLDAEARSDDVPGAWRVRGAWHDAIAPAAQHAVLDLALTVTVREVATTVTDLRATDLAPLADLDAVDARIVAADGSLPSDPTALETRRFAEQQAWLLELLERPADLDLVRFLDQRGITDSAGFVAWFSDPQRVAALAIDLRIEPTGDERSEDIPVRAGLHVHGGTTLDLADILSAIQLDRARLVQSGQQPDPVRGARPRSARPFLVLCPDGVFEDADLPRLDPATADAATDRRAELARRLQPLGVAVASLPST